MQTDDRFKKIIRTRKNINIQDLSLTSTFQNYIFIFFLKKNYIIISVTFAWSFRITKYLIDLQTRYQEDFEYAANFKHLEIWSQIASQISFNCNTIVTG